MTDTQPLAIIGGTSLTVVNVYADRPAPDGCFSGCPHVHGLTDEAYFVLAGSGSLELHDLEHGFRTLPLKPGDYVQFPPNVLHRLISDGDLQVLAVIGNAGLAEHGDARIWFGAAVDEDPQRFEQLVTLPAREGIDGALQRRDHAVEAYLPFRDWWETDRARWQSELSRFLEVHRRELQQNAGQFEAAIIQGPQAAARRSLQRLATLPRPLDEQTSTGVSRPADATTPTLGMCGRLRQINALEHV